MKCVRNVQSLSPDVDARSLRAHVCDREKTVLRDTYQLINSENSPSQRLNMGYTTIYPTGSTTGHAHEGIEETYFVISGKGLMIVGEDLFEIEQGDALYVPPGEFHTTYQRGNMPLVILWVTGKVD